VSFLDDPDCAPPRGNVEKSAQFLAPARDPRHQCSGSYSEDVRRFGIGEPFHRDHHDSRAALRADRFQRIKDVADRNAVVLRVATASAASAGNVEPRRFTFLI
jgi:hypothetical protein